MTTPLSDVPFNYELFAMLSEAHSALLMYRNHDGSSHCECPIADCLRDWEERYPDSIKTERRRAFRIAKRSRTKEPSVKSTSG